MKNRWAEQVRSSIVREGSPCGGGKEKESPRFLQLLGAFIGPITIVEQLTRLIETLIQALVFYISCDSLLWLRIYCWSFTPNFPSTMPEKLCLGSKMVVTFLIVSGSSITMQIFGEDRTRHAGSRCENMVFFSVWLRGLRAVCSRGYTLNRYCGSILMTFSLFSQKWFLFQMHYVVLSSSLDGVTYFAKLWSKIIKTPKIGGKVCAHHFV